MREQNYATDEEFNTVNHSLNSALGGMTFSIFTVIYILLSFTVASIIKDTGLDSKSDAYLYISYLISPLAILAAAFIAFKLRKIHFLSVFPVKCHPKYYLIGILLIFGLLFSLSWVNDVTVKFFKLFGYVPREAKSYFPSLDGGKVVLALLVIAVIPAFAEELMFRGIILNCCENGAGGLRCIFITGFCFSIFHSSPEQTVYQFIAGCAFAFIAIRSHSVLPSVLMHFINNALIVILAACGCLDETGQIILSQAANIALIVISALSLIGGIIWLVLDKKPFKKCEKGGVKNFFLYASVAIAVLGTNWLLLLFGVN